LVSDDATPSDAAMLDTSGCAIAGPLIDRGLVVRYFLDDAPPGGTVDNVADSAPNPLDLDLIVDVGNGDPAFVEDGCNSGLQWTTVGTGFGRASVPIDGTKIATAFSGQTDGTIELVVAVQNVSSNASRLSMLGQSTSSGRFTLRMDNNSELEFRMRSNDSDSATWPVEFAAQGRTVLHLVFDSTESDDCSRTRLYIDGVLTGSCTTNIDHNLDIQSPHSWFYTLGNREAGDRTLQGTIYYAAMYEEPLNPSEVQQNSMRLIANDDAQ